MLCKYSDGGSNANRSGRVRDLGRFVGGRPLAWAAATAPATVRHEQTGNKVDRFFGGVGQLAAVPRVNEDLNPMMRDDQVEHEIGHDSQPDRHTMEGGAFFDFVRIGRQCPDEKDVTGQPAYGENHHD